MNFAKHPGGRPPKYQDEGGRQMPHTVYLTPALRAYVLTRGKTVSAGINRILRDRIAELSAQVNPRADQ